MVEGALAAKQEGAEGLRGVGVEMLTSEGLARQAQSVPSTLITGILHGCTGTGHLLGVMPALAMPSWLCASAYLTSFGLGTMIAMSLFTAVVGEASAQMSARLNQRDLPAKLAMASSIFALIMGFVWTSRACAALSVPQLLSRWVGLAWAALLPGRLGAAFARA
eukprot:Transcript_19412.p3 GENE.Transcript_19412~~Transcript_19412.p3  ORF type:complete len:164 (-),score=59.12 Transcript_19412:327-818(-)